MIDWLSEHPWLVEGIFTMVVAAMVGTIVYFWIEHFRGE
tara:strand:+ start:110 stop:226 length:117 start_codon:yes stop_codon:yes gene_type:complete